MSLEQNPSMRVSMLSQDLGVSVETVRRDLSELEKAGRLNRTYGGAVRDAPIETMLASRMTVNIAARQAIASAAVAELGEARSIFIAGGSTTLFFARALSATSRRRLVITPALNVARELGRNDAIEVMLLPGMYDPLEGLVQGPSTIEAIEKYRAEFAFVGATGINHEGVSEDLVDAAQVTAAIVRRGERTFVLADSGKFDKVALTITTRWSENIGLITDRAPASQTLSAIANAGSRLIVVD